MSNKNQWNAIRLLGFVYLQLLLSYTYFMTFKFCQTVSFTKLRDLESCKYIVKCWVVKKIYEC